MKNSGESYLRLNRDQFSNVEITMIPDEQIISAKIDNKEFQIESSALKSIFFRAPIFLRNNNGLNYPINDYFSRYQWASFLRSLIIFEDVLWVNHPQATYNAEIKPYQLYKAKKIGFQIPKTIITNSTNQNLSNNDLFAIKTLDPMKLNIDGQNAFIYTNLIQKDEFVNANISNAPVILQQAIVPKIDIRVTVVDDEIFAVSIKKDGAGITGDWRIEKSELEYEEINLPNHIQEKCIEFTQDMGLKFAGIDLAYNNNEYFFIEINPTGQWAWLMYNTNLKIDQKIAKLLLKGK